MGYSNYSVKKGCILCAGSNYHQKNVPIIGIQPKYSTRDVYYCYQLNYLTRIGVLPALEKLVHKLGAQYVDVINRSMTSFKEHVSKAHHNVLMDFIFPIPIRGLTD